MSSLSLILESAGDKSNATQPLRALQAFAQTCLFFVPLSTGHFSLCHFAPRQRPFPIILNLAGSEMNFDKHKLDMYQRNQYHTSKVYTT